ncbi:hypothetical protein ACLOJK_024171 [Asimina triloba]
MEGGDAWVVPTDGAAGWGQMDGGAARLWIGWFCCCSSLEEADGSWACSADDGSCRSLLVWMGGASSTTAARCRRQSPAPAAWVEWR